MHVLKGKFRTRKVAAVAALAGAGSMLLMTSMASASTAPAANNTLIGSGSATTYNLMQGMDTLYNDSPGCNLITIPGVTQPLNFQCPSANNTTTPPVISTAYPNYPDFTQSSGYTDNPANDISVQEPPLGSSNGIGSVEGQGTSSCAGLDAPPVSYARSSRALSTSDCQGLNFVAYAVDGVTYFHFTQVGGHSTPSASVTSLPQSLLTDAWNGTLQCWNDPVVAAGGGTPTYTYSTSGCQPIILYTAQAGSGTLATWNGYLGVNTATYLDSINGTVIPNVQGPSGTTASETYNSNLHTILENETREILPADAANALFFFSWGKYQVACKKGCGVTGVTGTTTPALGAINGITATKNTILCGANVGGTGCGPTTDFPSTRFIYNVYSDGENAKIPVATPSALNYVSEVGFICKSQTLNGKQTGTKILDPNTGVWYRTEVAKVITAWGFIPMPWQTTEVGTSVTNDAAKVLTSQAGSSPLAGEINNVDVTSQHQTATAEHGYCLAFTTDGNTNT
jgi:ABC-type phosphate transport system substrate-binding protein